MSNYFELQNAPVLTTPSALTAPKITSIGYPGDDTAADPAGGQTITLTGEGFEAGASVIVNNAAVGVVSVVSSTTITFTSPALSTGSYPVYVVNTDGGTAIAVPGIQYSGTPTWTTAAGSLGSYTETQAISNTVTATGDAPVTYSVFSGTLPTGATLNSANGLISGTSPITASPTTYTFTIRATDAQQQDTNRQFSLTINPDVVTWSSPANGTTYTTVVDSAISNVALSATAASGQSVTYTANALPTGLSISGSNITGTPTVVANSSTLLTATASTTNATATRTINWVISVASDQYFEYVTTLLSASNPASTFVTDASTNNFAVSVFGDTRPNNFNPYTPGYYSAYFDGTGDYLVVADNPALEIGDGVDFTLELWFYAVTATAARNAIFTKSQSGIFAPYSINIMSDLTVTYYSSSNGSSWNVANAVSFGSVSLGTWNHVAVSRSGSSIRLFLNGALSTTLTFSGALYDDAVNLGIGARNDGTEFFNGYISNARLVKGTAIYTSAFTPPTQPLTAVTNTQLLVCSSNRFIDNSTNNFTITRNGDTLVSGFDPFAPNSSYSTYGSGYFDGTGDYLTAPADSAFNFGTGDFTVEAWVYPTSTTGTRPIIEIRTAAANATGFALLSQSGASTINVYTNGGFAGASTNSLTLNAWNHVALVRSVNTWTYWINGVSGGSFSNSSTQSDGATTGPKIGGSTTAGEVWVGYMSNVRIVKGTAVYTGAFTPPTSPLTAVANTQLLTLQNNQPNNNNMFLDSSTNNFLITRNGNTTQGSFSPYGGGWSNYFDGTGDYLSIASNSAFSFGTGDFTVECWANFSVTTADKALVSRYGSWVLRYDTGLAFNNGDSNIVRATFTPVVGTWYHFAVARQGTTLRLFINGVLSASATNSTSLDSSDTLFIGRLATGIAWEFQGYISNVRIVKGTAVYTSNFTPPTAPLTAVAGTSLLTCADNRFIDDSANNFTITRNGDVSVQRFNPFNPVLTTPTSYSGYFDGSSDYLTFNGSSSMAFGTGDFTIECWVNVPSIAAYNTIIDARPSDGAVPYALSITNSGTLAWYNGSGDVVSTSALSINSWTHIAISRSGTTLRFFINGVAAGSSTDSINYSSTNSATRIGANLNTATNPYRGYISNLRVVKGTAVYTSAFTPSTTPLTAVANTSLLTLQNATFVDNSTNNFTITANGDSVPRQFNPFGWANTTGSSAAYSAANYGGSMYFDGNGDYLSVPNSTALNFMNSNYTVEALIYPTATPGATYGACVLSNTTNASNGWLLRLNSSLQFSLVYPGIIAYNFGPVISLNTWNHVAIVRNGTQVTGYVNGVGYSLTTVTPAETNGPWNIGYAFLDYFTGYISNLRIVKGQALYTSNFAPPVAPLAFNVNTTLQVNGTGAAVYDSSMMATYETVGNASSTGVIKKYGNSSMSFDGTGDYLVSPFSVNNNLGTGSFTFEAWLYPNSISGIRGFYALTGGSGSVPKFVIHLNSGTPSIHYNGLTGGSDIYTTATSAITANTWTHLAFVRNGSTWTWYINGVASGTGSNSTNITFTTQPLYVGYGGESYFTEFNGYIDDLRITKGVARYTSNFTPPTTPFIQN